MATLTQTFWSDPPPAYEPAGPIVFLVEQRPPDRDDVPWTPVIWSQSPTLADAEAKCREYGERAGWNSYRVAVYRREFTMPPTHTGHGEPPSWKGKPKKKKEEEYKPETYWDEAQRRNPLYPGFE